MPRHVFLPSMNPNQARRLRDARIQAGLTETKAAADAGISLPYLSQLEHGQRSPRPRTLIGLALVYGVDPLELGVREDQLEDPRTYATGIDRQINRIEQRWERHAHWREEHLRELEAKKQAKAKERLEAARERLQGMREQFGRRGIWSSIRVPRYVRF
jgi:transcriptional regulator with XRE-family HTH domain